MKRLILLVAVAMTALGLSVLPALADGNQTLGPPSATIASGTGIATGGTGLAATGSGTIGVTVPDGATVEQVLLYWEGQYYRNSGGSDPDLVVEGTEVTGTLIGTSFHFNNATGSIDSDTYRADITGLGLVSAGANSIDVSGAEFGFVSDGAGVIVIYDDGSEPASIDIRDGNDGAFINFPEPRKSTIVQTFTFAPSTEARTAQLAFLVSSVNDPVTGSSFRPNLVALSGGLTTTFVNPFGDHQGDHWDSQLVTVTIPAGATELKVEVVSADPTNSGNLPASLFWNAAGFSIESDTPPPDPGCTLTIGYWKTHSALGPAAYDPTWDAKAGGDAIFMGTSKTYMQALQTEPKGNAYYILAHQYIGAELNTLAGAAVPAEVSEAMADATALLDKYKSTMDIPKRTADRTTAIALADILDDYNNGLIGPGHCD